MRIDRLEIENFKRYARQAIDLHPHFTLLVGENGAGKTTLLDALAVAAGIWLVEPPDSTLGSSRRNIAPTEIRLEAEPKGDRVQFREHRPVQVRAFGQIGACENVSWTRQIRASGKRTSNADARDALACIREIYERDARGEDVLCPVLAYYGAGRAWLPSNQPIPRPSGNGVARRWSAFYDCFNERIRFGELQKWFSRETIERGNRGGRWRPGFDVVRGAILRCVPDSDDVWFDTDRDQIVLSTEKQPQPFDNLSAGQRMMLALVADLAIKAVTQNAFLVSRQAHSAEPRVLVETPGLVLIDELDVHLHPKWQRRVVADLKATFPGIQFVGTSHSPQVIGEVMPEEIRVLDSRSITTPGRSFGIDSSRVLEEVMQARARNGVVQRTLDKLYDSIDREDFAAARELFEQVESDLGANDSDVVRARAMMAFLKANNEADS